MSGPSQHCPNVWLEITTPHRVCGRRSNTGSCEGITYSTGSEQYDQVCGRIIGYQFGQTGAFVGSSHSINTSYVDGVSVTPHGSPLPPLTNTSGPLLLVLMNRQLTLVAHAPVSLGALMKTVSPHLWVRTTSVSLA